MSVTTPVKPRVMVPNEASQAMKHLINSDLSENLGQVELRPWLLCLSVLPFLAIPIAHLLSNIQTATGFFHYELPYYVANGRAALERGNGLFYPNPFDPAADAPAIYAHWLPEVMGIATSVFGADPGNFILCLTFAAALLFAAATHRLVTACLPCASRNSSIPFLAVMWGGGVLAISSAVSGLLAGDSSPDLLRLDPGNGMWFLNWGRNALFPTEAIYHALVACCWLAEIRRRQMTANIFLLLLVTTHPWSGLELLLTINLWRGVRMLLMRQRSEVVQLGISAAVLLAFLAYYKLWLPSFEQHAALQSVWELDWSLKWSSAIPAWGVAAAVAVYRLWKEPAVLQTTTVQFLLCALTVAAGLSLHDRLIRPVQPLHFTRGYVWMPLILLGAPAFVPVVLGMWQRSVLSRVAVCCLGLLFVTDNLVFGAIQSWRQYHQEEGFHLSVHDRALLAELHEKHLQSVVLTESTTLNYLLPAYADHRPWLGHQFNTPEYPERVEVMQHCFAGPAIQPDAIPPDINLLVVRLSRDCQPLVTTGAWLACGTKNAEWSIWLKSQAE